MPLFLGMEVFFWKNMLEFNRHLPYEGQTVDSVAQNAWDKNIHSQAAEVASNSWKKYEPTLEDLKDIARDVIEFLGNVNFSGLIAENIYLAKQPVVETSNDAGGSGGVQTIEQTGEILTLDAVWSGAENLAGDSRINGLFLERGRSYHPNQTRLRLESISPEGVNLRKTIVFTESAIWKEIGNGSRRYELTRTDIRLAANVFAGIPSKMEERERNFK